MLNRSASLALLTLAAAASCARQRTAVAADRPAAERTVGSYSLYDLPSSWRDQQGTTRTLASLHGRPVVLAMIYTECTASCPLTLVDMKRIEASTDARVGLVLVSLDPTRDTPDRLRMYASSHELSPSRWTLLSGTDDDVRDLAAALGVRYRRLSRDEIAHSNAMTLLDASGRVVQQEAGLGRADDIIAAARQLAR